MLLRRALVAAALLTAGTEAFVLPVCVPGGCSGYAAEARPASQRPALGLRMSATTGESGPISRKEKTKQKKAAKAEDSVRMCYFFDLVEDCLHIHTYTCVHMHRNVKWKLLNRAQSAPWHVHIYVHARIFVLHTNSSKRLQLSAHLHTHMRSDMHVHVHQHSFFHTFMYTACLLLPHSHTHTGMRAYNHALMHTSAYNMYEQFAHNLQVWGTLHITRTRMTLVHTFIYQCMSPYISAGHEKRAAESGECDPGRSL